MKLYPLAAAVLAALVVGLSSCATTAPSISEKARQQADVRNMVDTSLSQLYANQPRAKDAIMGSAGYAVFSDAGFKLVYGGGLSGKGLAVNRTTNQETFMEMMALQPGWGFGGSSFRVVFIFDTLEAFDHFVNSGWEFGDNTMTETLTGDSGAALTGTVTVSNGVTMMQLDEAGLIKELRITAAKFYRDKGLN
jgi:lipid-binding SYLF domain-containing protein